MSSRRQRPARRPVPRRRSSVPKQVRSASAAWGRWRRRLRGYRETFPRRRSLLTPSVSAALLASLTTWFTRLLPRTPAPVPATHYRRVPRLESLEEKVLLACDFTFTPSVFEYYVAELDDYINETNPGQPPVEGNFVTWPGFDGAPGGGDDVANLEFNCQAFDNMQGAANLAQTNDPEPFGIRPDPIIRVGPGTFSGFTLTDNREEDIYQIIGPADSTSETATIVSSGAAAMRIGPKVKGDGPALDVTVSGFTFTDQTNDGSPAILVAGGLTLSNSIINENDSEPTALIQVDSGSLDISSGDLEFHANVSGTAFVRKLGGSVTVGAGSMFTFPTNEDTPFDIDLRLNGDNPTSVNGPNSSATGPNAQGLHTVTPELNFPFDNPNPEVTNLNFTVGGPTHALNITVSPINDTPLLIGLIGGNTYTEDGPGVVIDDGATLSDIELDARNGENGDYSGASLVIERAGGATPDDDFGFAANGTFGVLGNQLGDVTPGDPPTINAFATFTNSGGTLTVNFGGSLTPTTARVNAVLQNITYVNDSFFPPTQVTLSYTFNDGASGGGQGTVTGSTQAAATATVLVNRLPVLSNLNGGSFFTENGDPINVDLDVTVADRELDGVGGSYDGASLDVRRAGGAAGQDVLSLDTSGDISIDTGPDPDQVLFMGTPVADIVTGSGSMTITFNANATAVIADKILQAVTYDNTSDAPPEFVFMRYSFNDGFGTTAEDAKVNITRINDAPVFTNLDGMTGFVEGGDPVNVDSDVEVSDAELDEANNYAGVSVVVERDGGAASQDVLSIDPDLGPASNVVVSGNNLQTEIEVSEGNFQDLTFGTFAYANGTLTINFDSSQTTATGDLVDDVLRHITYDNTSENPPDEVDLRYTLSDGNSGAQGGTNPEEATGTAEIMIDTANDAPVLGNLGGGFNYTENDPATLIDADGTVSDVELDVFNNGDGDYAGASLTVERDTGANTDDLFGFDISDASFVVNGMDLQAGGLIFGSVTSTVGTLSVEFNSEETPATTALVNEVLQSLTYENASDDPDTDVTLDYTFNDGNTGAQGIGDAAEDMDTVTITIERDNDLPLIVDLDTTIHLLVTDQPLPIDADIDIVDPELDALGDYAGASFTVTNPTTPSTDDVFDIDDSGATFTVGATSLLFGGQPFATYTNAPGTLTINFNSAVATATPELVDEVLQRITYENSDTGGNPTADLSYTFSDGNTLDAQGTGANPGEAAQLFTIVNNLDPVFKDLSTIVATSDPETHIQTHVEDGGPTLVDVFKFFENDPEDEMDDVTELAVTLEDRELDNLNNYGGSTLTVQRDGGANAEDLLSLDTSGTISISDADVIIAGNVVATIDLAAQALGTLALTFTGNSTAPDADTIIQAITYETLSNTPPGSVDLTYSFDDHLGDPSGTVTEMGNTINITPVNDGPTATNDTFGPLDEDTQVVGNLITTDNGTGVDSDPDGDTLTIKDANTMTPEIDPATPPVFGSLVLSADGSFTYTPFDDFDGTDLFVYSITDGNGGTSQALVTILYNPINDEPAFQSLGGPNVFIENGPPIRIDTNVTVFDPELDDLHGGSGGDHAGATMTLFNAGGVSADDVFGFDTSGSFSVSGNDLQSGGQTFATFTNTAGVLTVNFTSSGTTATAALVDDVTQRLTYENLDPATHTDVDLTFTYDDGNLADAQGTGPNPGTTSDTINVIVNRVPVFDDLDGGETYTEDGGPVIVDSDLTIADRELDAGAGGSGDYSGATLTVNRQGGANSDDVISLEESGGLSISGSNVVIGGDNVATINSSGSTLALMFYSTTDSSRADQILQAINYENNNDNPPASVTLDYLFDDGLGTPAGTASGTASIDITPVNDAPLLVNLGPNSDTAYTDGGGPVIIDTNATIVDAELDFFNSGSGDYGGSTLTVARNTLPSADDSFDFDTSGSFTVLGGSLVANSTTFATFTNVAGTLTINFNSNATSVLADEVLARITYEFVGAILPTDVDIDFTFDDGNLANAQGTGPAKSDTEIVNILINELPAISDLDGGNTFIEDAAAVVVDGDATVADRELDNLDDYDGATLSVSRDGGANSEDVLSLDESGAISLSGSDVVVGGNTVATLSTGSGTLTVTFNGNSTTAIAQQVLQAVNYANTNNNPPSSVTLLYTFDDGIGTPNPTGMASDTATVNITAANDLPVIAVGPMGDSEFASTAGPVIMDSDGTITDAELDFLNSGSGNFAGATLTVERVGGANPDDEFDFDTGGASFTVAAGNLQSSLLTFATFTSSGGTMTINFDSSLTTATSALVNDVLQHITYANVSAAPPVNVEIEFTIDDGNAADAQGIGDNPGVASDTVIIKINNPPIFGPGTLDGGNTYTEDGPAVAVDTDVQVADAELDSANSYSGASLTVERDGGANGDDVLTLSSGTISVVGTDVKHSGVTIGTIAGNGTSSLSVTLNSNATSSRADQVLQAVNYLTPRQDPPASISLRYTFDDGLGGTVTGTAVVNITAVNDDPVAQDDSFTIDEDETLMGNVLDDNGSGADSDIDGDTLSVNTTPVSGPDHAQFFELLSDGSFTYTPDDNYNGPDSFVYELMDGTTTVQATVNITIDPINDAPLAQDDDVSVDEDTQLAGNVLNDNGNGVDSDVEGDTLTVTAAPVDDVDNGTLVLNTDGSFTYDPDPDFNGADSFEYEVTDGNGGASTATVTITVNPTPDDPVAQNDGFTTDEDTLLSGENVLNDNGHGADSDADGETLTVNTTPVDDVDNGTLVLNSDGTFTYDPDEHFNGTDSFEYEVGDGTGATATAVVTITVTAINDLPIAQDDDFTIDEDTGLAGELLADNGNGVDSDADGDTLTVDTTPVTGPTDGSVVLNSDGSFTYTPNLNFNGSDSFEYEIDDGNGATDIGLVSITIDPVNDPPAAQNDLFSVDEDMQLAGDVLADNGNGADSDVEDDTLTVNTTPTDDVDNGTLNLNSDGTFTYDPDPDFNGSDSFVYEVSDGNGGLATATVDITIDPIPDDPVARDDTFTIDEDAQLSGNVLVDNGDGPDTDADGQTLTVNTTPVSGPTSGTLMLNSDGSFTYSPTPHFHGVDSFEYEISDGTGGLDIGEVTITINSINDVPIANGDVFSVDEDMQLGGNVLDDNGNGEDTDADGDTLTVDTNPVNEPANGVLVLNSDGTFTYDPDPDFNGVDSFEYAVDDGNGGASTATVTITVDPIPDDPVAQDDDFATDEDVQLVGNVLDDNGNGADSDPDGETLTVNTTPIDDVDNGTLVLNADGSFTYDPTPNYHGPDSFEYEIDDGTGALATAVVNITVNSVNDLPVAQDDDFATDEDTQVGGNVLDDNGNGADSDTENDTLTVNTTPVVGPSNGSLVLNSDGTFTYDPDPDFNGVDSFEYQLDDGNGGLDTAVVTITVNSIPDDPIAQDDDFTIDEDNQAAGNVLDDNGNGVDSDGDSDPLTVNTTPVSGPSNGLLVLNTDGSFTYDPTDHFTGVDMFEYELQDGTGGLDIGLVTINISSINDVPLFVDLNDDNAWREDLPAASIDPDATIFDPDLDVLNGGLGDFAGASLTISNADGFDPNDSFDINDAGANFNIVGGNLQSGGQTFATFTNLGGTLTIDFTSSGTPATTALVNEVLQRVTYENTSIVLPEDLNIELIVNDGNSADAQGTGDNPGETTQVIHFIINELPVLNNLDGGASYTEDQPPVIVDPDVTVDDRELDNRGGSGDYNGATLTVERDGGANAEDVISLEESGGISISGSDVIVGGNTVATINSSGGTMTLAFTSDATSAIADQLLQAVNYENSNQDPPTSVTLSWTFNDGIGADPGIASGTADVTIVPVNDDPVFTSPDAFNVEENTTDVGTVAATDVDGPGPITFAISGGADQSFFSINTSTGELSFNTPPDFEAQADDDGDNVYLVEVDASDGGTGLSTQMISVTVLDVSDVLAVKLGGSAWVQSYRDALDPDAGQGHSVPFGAGQLDTLPWVNLDELYIVFGEDVEIELTDLSLVGVNVADYGPMIDGFNYDSGSFTASWTLDTPIDVDKLLITLSGVTTVGLGNPVDFEFQFHVLPGDADHDDTVAEGDRDVWVANFGQVNGNEDQAEFNGNGVVTSADYTIIADNYNDTLPAGEPGGGGGSGSEATGNTAETSEAEADGDLYEVSSFRTTTLPPAVESVSPAAVVSTAPVAIAPVMETAIVVPVTTPSVVAAETVAVPTRAVTTPVRVAAVNPSAAQAAARLLAATSRDTASDAMEGPAAAVSSPPQGNRLPAFFSIGRTALADRSPLATRTFLAQPAPLPLGEVTSGQWLANASTSDANNVRAEVTDRVLAEYASSSGEPDDERGEIDEDRQNDEREESAEATYVDEATAEELIDAALTDGYNQSW